MLPVSSPPSITLDVEAATSLLLVAVLAAAVYTDLRWGRIYNKLTLGAAGAGLLLNLLAGGFEGGLHSAGGWLLGAGFFILFFALGAMGAGDVKLLAAVGALKGPSFVFQAFLFTALAGGLIAVLVLVRRRRLGETFARLAWQLHGLVPLVPAGRSDGASSPLRFPYGVAIALGSCAALFLRI